MPHKRNPVSGSSKSAASRAWWRATPVAAFENIALWHVRDISHSSVERVILPDSTILVDYMLHKTTEIVANMKVFPGAHAEVNPDATMGRGFFGAAFCRTWSNARGRPREDSWPGRSRPTLMAAAGNRKPASR